MAPAAAIYAATLVLALVQPCISAAGANKWEVMLASDATPDEAFAAQVLTVSRELGMEDDDPRINPNGGAIALGHPLGMSGARLVLTAVEELHQRQEKLALCSMCIGVGQGISMLLERV